MRVWSDDGETKLRGSMQNPNFFPSQKFGGSSKYLYFCGVNHKSKFKHQNRITYEKRSKQCPTRVQ